MLQFPTSVVVFFFFFFVVVCFFDVLLDAIDTDFHQFGISIFYLVQVLQTFS